MAELNTASIEGSLTVSETASIGGDLTANGEIHGASIESSGILKGASLIFNFR